MVTLTYNPQNGTNNGIMYVPMQPTIIKLNPYFKEQGSSQNTQPQTPAMQRTYRQESHNYIKLLIVDDEAKQETPMEQYIVDAPKEERKLTKHSGGTAQDFTCFLF